MDYKPLLERDYKPQPPQRRRPGSNRGHLLLLLFGAVVFGVLLSLTSVSVQADRSQATDAPGAGVARLTLPLALPPSLGSETPPLEALEVLPEPEEAPWQTVTVQPGDSLALIFKRLGLAHRDLADIIALGAATATLKVLHPGQRLKFLRDADGQLSELVYEIDRTRSLSVHRSADGFRAVSSERELDVRVSYAQGTIDSSLFLAAQGAGLSENLTMEMAAIFAWDIDFALDIREGDRFSLLFEEHYLDGEKVRDGAILAAEFTNQGKTFRAIRYTDASGRADYYTPEGLSMRKAFLRTPVSFSRISSRFGKRKHPVLNRFRMHKGVDYAAPTGTPVKAAGDGKVVFRGVKGGYGRTVILAHGGRYSTLYAHMSKFARGVRHGARVRQGQVIGYVGQSGLATGPHLHYEFRVNGAHRNPLTVRLPEAAPIDARYRDAYAAYADKVLAQLEMHRQLLVARGL